MNVKWLLAPAALLAGPIRRLARLAGVSALASLTVSFVRTHTSAALHAGDAVLDTVLRVTHGPVAHTAPTSRREATVALGPGWRAKVDERFLSVAVDSSLVVG